jgi:glycosyltransferase involved in cell wall biosynthesis
MSKVSVIIPVKNRANLLRKTLNNLLSQSLPPHEIIVVDDHSTDNIRQVIFDYITEATFLNNEGIGPGAARNLGLSHATGEFIQFFDSDDLMATDKLESQVRALEKSGADMAYGPYVKTQKTEKGWIQKDAIMQWLPITRNLSLTNAILRGWNAITQACLFRKSFLDSAPKWDENLITHEDYLYLFRLSLLNPRLVHVPQSGVLYRQHGAQSTDQETRTRSRAKDRLQVLVEMRKSIATGRSGMFSRALFSGRLKQAYDFLESQGEDMRPYRGFIQAGDPVCKILYRIYNKQMRIQTRTNWEPMHGLSVQADHFQHILNSCLNG